MREVIVWPAVHNALWQTLDRASYEKVVDRLFDQLGNNYDRWGKRRDAEDPALFVYPLYVAEGDRWHTLRFSVDDSMSQDHLFVLDMSHEVGKVWI